MGFSHRSTVTSKDILCKVSEYDILAFYLNINKIPCVINSPLREDNKPSFGLYSLDGEKIYFKDFATGVTGGIFDLFSLIWGLQYREVIDRIYKECVYLKYKGTESFTKLKHKHTTLKNREKSVVKTKKRDWNKDDIDYWNTYGISKDWLNFAEIYPISHIIVERGADTFTFPADKYAYVYIERKDNKVTQKVYQPFNKNGYKWKNNHDGSVISLFTKIPKKGNKLCICSSVKDALCLWNNLGIPSISLQGEGYRMKDSVIQELKDRFNDIYVLYDNDEAGLKDAEILSKYTGFKNIILPFFKEGKDVSDFYKNLKNKKEFLKLKELFNV